MNTQEYLQETFAQCMRPKDYAEPAIATLELTKAQQKEISHFVYKMGFVMGVTLEGVRYLTNRAVMISSFSIVTMDAWQVFRHIFEALGDTWRIDRFGLDAEKIDAVKENDTIIQAIASWTEELEELTELVSVEGVSILTNEAGQAVYVNSEYLAFVSDYLGFSVNDVPSPLSPITLTHCQSMGFAGLLMPMKVRDSALHKKIRLLENALELLKGEPECSNS